jgi:hypothetical protein
VTTDASTSGATTHPGVLIHGASYTAVLGGEKGRRKMAAAAANYLDGSQTDQFAFVPSMSIVSPGWAARDPSFWKHRSTPLAP